LAVLQCTSRYPTALDQVGLNVIDEMRARYGVPAGLSDHSGVPHPAIAAIARGADVIEAHLTLDRGMFGPDVSSSLTVEEFRMVSDFRAALARMTKNPVDKDAVAAELAPMRKLFGRSLAPSRLLVAGTVLAADMLAAKKPATGIPERDMARVIGRRLLRDVEPGRLLRWDDIES
jgi:N,N'-diacetyllegionaminate synthase